MLNLNRIYKEQQIYFEFIEKLGMEVYWVILIDVCWGYFSDVYIRLILFLWLCFFSVKFSIVIGVRIDCIIFNQNFIEVEGIVCKFCYIRKIII